MDISKRLKKASRYEVTNAVRKTLIAAFNPKHAFDELESRRDELERDKKITPQYYGILLGNLVSWKILDIWERGELIRVLSELQLYKGVPAELRDTMRLMTS